MPPDAKNQNGNGNGGEPPVDSNLPYDFHDDPIRDLVSEGDHDEPGDGEAEGDKGDKGDAPISPALQSQLDKINERLAESDQIIQYQRGQINILENIGERGNKEASTPPAPEPLLKVDKAAISKALGDPDTAAENLVQMFTEFGENILKRVNQVNEDTANQFRTRDANESWRAAMTADRAEAVEEFGADVLGNPEFIKEADKELEKLLTVRGAKDIYGTRRGDFSGIAAKIYNRWLRSGKITINGERTNGNGNGNGNNNSQQRQAPRTIRELNTELNASDRPAGGGGRPGGGGGGSLSWESMYPNERERRIAQNAARKMGVSAEKWLKGYAANQAEDESYGR